MLLRQKSIPLRQGLVNRLVEEIHGGFDGLAAAWEVHTTQRQDGPKAPSRSTLYRWVSDGVPTLKDGSDHRFFTFCGLLDADPLAIFDFHESGYFSRFARLRQLIYYGRDSLGSIATLLDMYRPGDIWPSEEIAKNSFGHGWRANHLTNKNDWNNTNYILLRARFNNPANRKPRAVHIAYRRTRVPDSMDRVPDTMWRYYGTVLAIDQQVELYNESGDFQKFPQANEDEIQFRTYFGGRPVEWRIASLHEFSLTTDPEYPSNHSSVVTFTW
jgi:hypothetical protein